MTVFLDLNILDQLDGFISHHGFGTIQVQDGMEEERWWWWKELFQAKCEDAPKKHRSLEFCQSKSSNTGVVTKLHSREVRSCVTNLDAHTQVIICLLGQKVEIFSSQQTIYLENVVKEDMIGGLHKEIAGLKGMRANITNRMEDVAKSFAKSTTSLKERLNVSKLFLHQSMCIALHAFCDLISSAFSKHVENRLHGLQRR